MPHPPQDPAAPGPATPAKVFLLPLIPEPLFRQLALALAARGHSLAFIGPVAPDVEADDEAALALQLAVERAGGLSLIGPGLVSAEQGSLDWVVDFFGRLDAAIAWGDAGAALLAQALARLDRRARPPILLVCQPASGVEISEEGPAPTSSLDSTIFPTRMIHYPMTRETLAEEAAQAAAMNRLMSILRA